VKGGGGVKERSVRKTDLIAIFEPTVHKSGLQHEASEYILGCKRKHLTGFNNNNKSVVLVCERTIPTE
jgi:hypothetical protein